MKLKLFSLFVFLFSVSSLFSQNDTLVMKNGNMIVGEIKNMNRGIIQVETDYSDSDFKMDWDEVKSIKSDRTFVFLGSDGKLLDGKIKMSDTDSTKMVVYNNNQEEAVDLLQVVFIKHLDQKFLGRLSLELSAGYTLTKANNLHQFSLRSKVGYFSKRIGTDVSFNMVRNIQDEVDPTKRTELNLGFRYTIVKDWFAIISSNLLQNDEQKLKLRATTSGGIGNYIVNTNRIYFGAEAGLAWNNEQYTESSDDDRNSLEAMGALELNLFDIQDFSLITSLSFYPSITEGGRVRTNYDIDLKYDLPLDFFISLGFTLNYDNRPVEGASESDYVFQTTFGWEL